MTSFDLIVLGILIVSTGLAVIRGGLLELATLIALGIAWLAATQFATPLLDATGNDGSAMAVVISYGLITGVTFLILYIGLHLLRRRFTLSQRGTLIDRIAGGLFGFLRGYVLIGLGFLAYGYYLDEDHQHDSVKDALSRPLAASGARFFEQFIPESTTLDPSHKEEDKGNDPSKKDAATDGYGRAERAGLSEVITTVTTDEDGLPAEPSNSQPTTADNDPDDNRSFQF